MPPFPKPAIICRLGRSGHADAHSTCTLEGSVKTGKGEIDFCNGLFRSDHSFGSRFETGAGTNLEQLLGAAHASCFAMALLLILGEAGFTPDYVAATAYVTVRPQGGGFKITKSHIQYSRPHLDDRLGSDYDAPGRLGATVFNELRVPREADFYLCGPSEFLGDMASGLSAWGVVTNHIHTEIFGPGRSKTPGVVDTQHRPPDQPLHFLKRHAEGSQ